MVHTDDINKFSYEPIPTSPTNELNIRLIAIQPGTSEDGIKCTISHHSQASSIRYHDSTYAALSYMWGPPVITRAITLNGTPFPVRENLWLALYHLRLPDKERIIWIDALCINQDDIEERNSQVAQMGRVYSQAKEVLVWLGLDQLGLETSAIEVLKRLHDEVVWRRDQDFWQGLIHQWKADPEHKNTAKPEWEALVALCGLDYWKRLWIIQEVILGNNVRLFWGQGSLSWDQLFALLDKVSEIEDHREVGLWFRETSAVVTESMPFRLAGQKIGGGKVYRFGKDKIGDLIMSYQEAQCYDPRDKVFGMSGITGSEIVVDYSKSLAEVCADVLRDKFRQKSNELLETDARAKVWRGSWDVENLNTVSNGAFLLKTLQGADISLIDVINMKTTDQKSPLLYGATANVSGVVSFITKTIGSYRGRSAESITLEVLEHKNGEWLNISLKRQLGFLGQELRQCPELFINKFKQSSKHLCLPLSDKISVTKEPPTDPQISSGGKNPLTESEKKPWEESCGAWWSKEQDIIKDENMPVEGIAAELISIAASNLPPETLDDTRIFFSAGGLVGFAPKNAKEGDMICTFRDSLALAIVRQGTDRQEIVGLASSLDEDIEEPLSMPVRAGRMREGEVPDQMIRFYFGMETLLLICWFRSKYAKRKAASPTQVMSRVRPQDTSSSEPLPFTKRRLNPYLR